MTTKSDARVFLVLSLTMLVATGWMLASAFSGGPEPRTPVVARHSVTQAPAGLYVSTVDLKAPRS